MKRHWPWRCIDSRNAILMATAVLLLAGPLRAQSLVLVTDRPNSPIATSKEIRAAAKTKLQKQIAEVLITKGWPQNYRTLGILLMDVPAKDQVDALLPFIAFHRPATWIPQCNAAATNVLGELGTPAVPTLRKLLEHTDARQREAAASTLAHMAFKAQRKAEKPGSEAVEKLANLLVNDESVGVRREAARALYGYGSLANSAHKQICAALTDPDSTVRGMALEALGELSIAGDAAVWAAMEEIKRSKNKSVGTLQKMGPAARAALPMLLEMQQDPKLANAAQRAIAWIWVGAPARPEHKELIFKALPSGMANTAAMKITTLKLTHRDCQKAGQGLLKGLEHVSYSSGKSYAQAIGDLFKGDKAMIAELESRMGLDRSAPTRLYAAAAHFHLTGNEKRAVKILAAEIKGDGEGPRKGEIRMAAATMLGEFGPRGRIALPEVQARWERAIKNTKQGGAYRRAGLAPTLWKLTGRAGESINVLLKDFAAQDGAYARQTSNSLIEMAPLLTDRVTNIAAVLEAKGSWSSTRRWWVASVLAAIGPCEQSRKALPKLEKLMREDPSEYTKRVAAAAVWAITRDSTRVLPTLELLLKQRGRNVYYVLPLLASMGSEARGALPTLRKLAELEGYSVLSAEARATIGAIQQTPKRPDETVYSAWWNDLASGEGDKAVSAVWSFAMGGQEAEAFFAKRAKLPQDRSIAKRVEQLVRDLDSDLFRVREQASATLRKMLPGVEPDLRNALKRTRSLEVKVRLEKILRDLPDHGFPLTANATVADIRQAFRVLQVQKLLKCRDNATRKDSKLNVKFKPETQ